jgi:hypothetical protein
MKYRNIRFDTRTPIPRFVRFFLKKRRKRQEGWKQQVESRKHNAWKPGNPPDKNAAKTQEREKKKKTTLETTTNYRTTCNRQKKTGLTDHAYLTFTVFIQINNSPIKHTA